MSEPEELEELKEKGVPQSIRFFSSFILVVVILVVSANVVLSKIKRLGGEVLSEPEEPEKTEELEELEERFVTLWVLFDRF